MSCVKFLVSASCKRTTSEVVTIHNQKNLSILVEYPMYAKVNDNVVMFRIRNFMCLLQYEVLPLKTWVYNWLDKSKQNGFIPGPCQGNINEVGSVSRCHITFLKFDQQESLFFLTFGLIDMHRHVKRNWLFKLKPL